MFCYDIYVTFLTRYEHVMSWLGGKWRLRVGVKKHDTTTNNYRGHVSVTRDSMDMTQFFR